MPGSTTISALTSADPSSNSLLVGVVNSTTVKTNVEEAVGYWSTAAGDMVYADGARSLVRLAAPTSGAVLTYSSGTSAPTWSVPTSGAVLIASSLGTPTWLALGSSGQRLESTGGAPAWVTGAGATTNAWQISRETTLGLASGWQVVSWNVENIDTDGAFSTAASASVVTVPTSGTYLLHARISMTGGASLVGVRILEGSTVVARALFPLLPTIDESNANLSVLRKFASSGATLSVAAFSYATNTVMGGVSSGSQSFFWGHRLS